MLFSVKENIFNKEAPGSYALKIRVKCQQLLALTNTKRNIN